MNKRVKIGGIGALLAVASFFYGKVCGGFGEVFPLLLSPSRELVDLLIWFLSAVCAVLVSVELAAALVRPLRLGIGLFAVGALGMLLGSTISPTMALLSLVYLLGMTLYTWRTEREIGNRITFSVGVLSEKQGIMLASLVFIASAHLYLGAAQHIRRQGLSLPQGLIEMYSGWMEDQIVEGVPPEERAQAREEFRREFQSQMEGMFDRLVERYEAWIPLVIALGVYMTLHTAIGFLTWIPGVILGLVIALLKELNFIIVVTDTREVQRLSL